MPIALTVFGVATPSGQSTFCYAFFRVVRGFGPYPPPVASHSRAANDVWRIPLEDLDLELQAWDKVLGENEVGLFLEGLDRGEFLVPPRCPIEPGVQFKGTAYGPISIHETSDRIQTAGTGMLHVRGLTVDSGVDHVLDAVRVAVGSGLAPLALLKIVTAIGEYSGLGAFLKNRRRIGVVDRFYRASDELATDDPMFDVGSANKPSVRNKAPMNGIRIRRVAAPLDKSFQIHIVLKNYDEVLKDALIPIHAGQSEIVVEADSHVTDLELSAFEEDVAVHFIKAAFLQGFSFGLQAIGAADVLPPAFKGAPASPELEKRPRLHTLAFDGPSAGNRSGGLDVLRGNRKRLEDQIGEPEQKLECRWFEAGRSEQVEVIRWIKGKLEKPGNTIAYFVDPYLGSAALERVVVRQGNENIALSILVSPGDVDPDADQVNEKKSSAYLQKLVASAKDRSNQLCGEISIFHIKRGDGSVQAFHDRYLCVLNSRIPTVYMLSNSLSKAAGNWPFAIVELNRTTSWRVYHYILGLLDSGESKHDLTPELLWSNKDSKPSAANSLAENPISSAIEPPAWVNVGNAYLKAIWDAVLQHRQTDERVSSLTFAFISAWPADLVADAFVDGIWRRVGHLENIIVLISSLLDGAQAPQKAVAEQLNQKLLTKFIESFPEDGAAASGHFSARPGRDRVLIHVGRTIALANSPTNYVRSTINPRIGPLVELIETQRFPERLANQAFDDGLLLVSVGLEVAIAATSARIEHRLGVARDYIHWGARLARSYVAYGRFNDREHLPESWEETFDFSARQIMAARRSLGEQLDASVQMVRDDQLVVKRFKDLLY